MRKRFFGVIAVTALAALAVGLSLPASATSPTPATTVTNFTAINPVVRVLDTRTTVGGHDSALGQFQSLTLALAGHDGIPANATAVVLNVTVTGQTAASYLSLTPSGSQSQPIPSQVSFHSGGGDITDEVTVGLGSGGAVNIYNHVGSVQVVADLTGYYSPTGVQAPLPPATASALTSLTNWPESSGWATDTFTRSITVQRHSAVDVSNCGVGATQCWFYTGTYTDQGTIVTVDGAATPAPSKGTISGANKGTMNGTGKFQFYAASDTPDAANVPTSVTGKDKGGRITTTTWGELFFPNSVPVAGATLTTYAYQYATPGTCETWVDSINPGDDGQNAATDGNITGVSACGHTS